MFVDLMQLNEVNRLDTTYWQIASGWYNPQLASSLWRFVLCGGKQLLAGNHLVHLELQLAVVDKISELLKIGRIEDLQFKKLEETQLVCFLFGPNKLDRHLSLNFKPCSARTLGLHV